MTGGHEALPQPVWIEEKFSRKIVRTSTHAHRSLSEAIFELVDNAVDEFDGYHVGDHLTVKVELGKDRIVVENEGGRGMGPAEFARWAHWGESDKPDAIGEYGQGGKGALGYLGQAWVIRFKRWDETWLWEVSDDNWTDTTVDRKRWQAVPLGEDRDHPGLGYCRFEIRKLSKRRRDEAKLRAQLGNVYRRLLLENKLTICVNGEPVPPFAIPLYEGFAIQEFREKTCYGWWLKGWVGRLKRDARLRYAIRIPGGMRLTRRGRLICDGEYFGHPDYRYKASLGMVIGEVELPRKEEVPILPNKTGFDEDSEGWHEVKTILHGVLKPHVEALLQQKDEDVVTKDEKKRATKARELMMRALDHLKKLGELEGKLGLDRGRKPREPKDVAQHVAPSRNGGSDEANQPRRPATPRTPAPPGAVGRLQRLGRMPHWVIRVLEPHIRSDWEGAGTQRCLVINKKFPLYQERGDGDLLYLVETAALELARPPDGDGRDLKDYLDDVNEILQAACYVYRTEQ